MNYNNLVEVYKSFPKAKKELRTFRFAAIAGIWILTVIFFLALNLLLYQQILNYELLIILIFGFYVSVIGGFFFEHFLVKRNKNKRIFSKASERLSELLKKTSKNKQIIYHIISTTKSIESNDQKQTLSNLEKLANSIETYSNEFKGNLFFDVREKLKELSSNINKIWGYIYDEKIENLDGQKITEIKVFLNKLGMNLIENPKEATKWDIRLIEVPKSSEGILSLIFSPIKNYFFSFISIIFSNYTRLLIALFMIVLAFFISPMFDAGISGVIITILIYLVDGFSRKATNQE